MEKLSYKLHDFEGPLDLLLRLISKNKLNIYDIQISLLLDQYMEQIQAMREQNMDVASEFLEMAARLVYLKTAMLLPKHEEAEELKKELTGQLLEYQECQKVAAMLASQLTFDAISRQPAELEGDPFYHRQHDVRELQDAYFAAAGKGKRRLPPPPAAFSNIVSRKIVSVGSRIIFVLRRLWTAKEVTFDQLLEHAESKSQLVATFLAVLELVKSKRVEVEEGTTASEFVLKMRRGGEGRWKSRKHRRQ